ncbi:hypothetical protein BSK33_09550 [Geobacillus sp. 44B]|nr:hypothetical protein BSK33_09550 [Geobacillus sp. 44B]
MVIFYQKKLHSLATKACAGSHRDETEPLLNRAAGCKARTKGLPGKSSGTGTSVDLKVQKTLFV